MKTDTDIVRIAQRASIWARELGTLALERSGRPHNLMFKDKIKRDPVTEVDHLVEAGIRERVAAEFPSAVVLGEEGSKDGDEPEYVWVVDPIDGTANFARGLPLWAVSIGVLRNRQPVAAAIYTPAGPRGAPAVYAARQAGGAWCDGERLSVASNDLPEPSGLIGMPGYWSSMYARSGKLARTPGEPRVLGSIAVEFALIAAGVLQYGVFGGPKIWDAAACVLLVQEAGGTILAKRRGVWAPMFGFEPAETKDEHPLTRLSKWQLPIVAGPPALASYVARHHSPSLRARWFIAWRRFKARMKR